MALQDCEPLLTSEPLQPQMTVPGVTYTPVTLSTEAGIKVPALKVVWTASSDIYVTGIQVEYYPTDNSNTPYRTSPQAIENLSLTTTNSLLAGVEYQVRFRACGANGIFGLWSGYTAVTMLGDFTSGDSVTLGGFPIGPILDDIATAIQMASDVSDAVILAMTTLTDNQLVNDARAFIDGTPIGSFVRDTRTITDDLIETNTLLGVKNEDGDAFTLNDTTVKISPTETLAQRFDQIAIDRDDAIFGAITEERTLWQAGDEFNASVTALIGGANEDFDGFIIDQSKLYWNSDTSLATKLSALQINSGEDNAGYDSAIKAWVDASSAGITWINDLDATFGGFKASYTSAISVVSGPTGLVTKETMAMDVNGHVIGTETVNDGVTGGITFVVDYLAVADAAGSISQVLFLISGGVVRMHAVEVDTIKVGTASQSGSNADGATQAFIIGTPQADIVTLTYTAHGGSSSAFFDLQYNTYAADNSGARLELYMDGSLVKGFDTWLAKNHGDYRFSFADLGVLSAGSHFFQFQALCFDGPGFEKFVASITIIERLG